MAVDQANHLFVASPKAITAYDLATGTILYSITSGIHHPTAMAFDAMGRLYVSNVGNSTVAVYGVGSDQLLQTVRAGVQRPSAVAIGP